MRALYALFLLYFLTVPLFGQKVTKKRLQGKWELVRTYYVNKETPSIKKDTTIRPAGASSIARKRTLRFDGGVVKCGVCSGRYKLGKEDKRTRIKLDLKCKRAGAQCFFGSAFISLKKDTLLISRNFEIEKGRLVQLTQALVLVSK